MTDVQVAQVRVDEAKRAFTRAAHAALRGLPLAKVQADVALEDLNAARLAIAKASVKASDTTPTPTGRQLGAP